MKVINWFNEDFVYSDTNGSTRTGPGDAICAVTYPEAAAALSQWLISKGCMRIENAINVYSDPDKTAKWIRLDEIVAFFNNLKQAGENANRTTT